MKSKISKLLGVALTVALLASLMAMAAPISARTLGWSTETIPSAANYVIATGIDVADFAVASDGDTIYAGDGVDYLYKSTNRGVSWSQIAVDDTDNETNLVAVAPDDSDIVAYVDVASNFVYASTDGGTTWGKLGNSAPTGISANTITGISISAASAGINYVAVAGNDGTDGVVTTYNMGAAAPAWLEISALAGFTADDSDQTSRAVALAYSPNFPSDQVLAVVTISDNASAGSDSVYLELFSENSNVWNTNAGFSSYPATVVSVGAITDAYSASIALDPEYLGSDDAMRLAFVGLNLTADATGLAKNGIHRMNDVLAKELKSAPQSTSTA